MIAEPKGSNNMHSSDRTPAPSQAAAMQDAVNSIICRLDTAGIPYCLLRNRDRIPWDLLNGAAVCLLVEDSVSKKQLIALIADLNPAQIAPRRDGMVSLYIPVGTHMLRVDVYTRDIEWRGAVLRKNRDILAGRWSDDGIMVAAPPDQAFISWLERLMRGKYKDRYTQFLTETIRANRAEFAAMVEDAFGKHLAADLMSLADSGQLAASRALIPACRRALWSRSLRKRPIRTLKGAALHGINAVEHRLRPAGISMALLGPDGAGKSTLTSAIMEYSSKRMPIADVDYVAFHRLMLPTVQMLSRRMKLKNHSARNSSTDPYGKPPLRPLVWFAYYSYHTLDYWLSEMVLNRQKKAHVNLVLHDRHPIEIPLDARRYRYVGPGILPKVIARLVPKPQLVIVLDAPPEVIQARKQEVTFEQTAQQVAAYRRFVERTPNAHLVDATQPAEQVQNEVIAIITNDIAARTRRRYGLPNLAAPTSPNNVAVTNIVSSNGTSHPGTSVATEHEMAPGD